MTKAVLKPQYSEDRAAAASAHPWDLPAVRADSGAVGCAKEPVDCTGRAAFWQKLLPRRGNIEVTINVAVSDSYFW
jgi:hypothetical protein